MHSLPVLNTAVPFCTKPVLLISTRWCMYVSMMHVCVAELGRHWLVHCQAIIWILETNFSEIPTQTFSAKKLPQKISAKWQTFCPLHSVWANGVFCIEWNSFTQYWYCTSCLVQLYFRTDSIYWYCKFLQVIQTINPPYNILYNPHNSSVIIFHSQDDP